MKKVIIILSILLSIILVVLIAISTNLNLESANENNADIALEKTLQRVENKSDYYGVKQIVERYYLFCGMIFDAEVSYNSSFEEYNYMDEDAKQQALQEAKKEIEQRIKENVIKLYNVLDEEVKNEKQITPDNVMTKLNKISKSLVNVTNIYVSEISNNINFYLVRGILKEETSQNTQNFQVIVKLDKTNNTFSIIPQEFVEEKYNNLEIGKEINITVQEKIEPNDNNTYESSHITEEKYMKDLFTKLRTEIYHFPKLVYNRLDEEYRNKKFQTYEKFEEFLNNNKKILQTMQIDSYEKEETDNYTQYFCMDKNEKYYIFRETAVMDYSVILDVYTVDIPKIVQEYDSSSDSTKVVLNIGKIIEATRMNDYEYVYNKLNATFRDNNFKNIEDFERFIKERYNPVEDTIEYKLYKQVTGMHVYGIEIKNISENKTIKADIVMNLKSGRDFEFSFSLGN